MATWKAEEIVDVSRTLLPTLARPTASAPIVGREHHVNVRKGGEHYFLLILMAQARVFDNE